MPRKPRFFLPDVPAHSILRGNSRNAVFIEEDDCRAYLHWLSEAIVAHECKVHAYVLMTNHVHLLVSASEPKDISRVSQSVGRKFCLIAIISMDKVARYGRVQKPKGQFFTLYFKIC